jgi:hypothetical protein
MQVDSFCAGQGVIVQAGFGVQSHAGSAGGSPLDWKDFWAFR